MGQKSSHESPSNSNSSTINNFVPHHLWNIYCSNPPSPCLTVLTYNLLADTWTANGHPRMNQRILRILDEFRQINATLICLQEIERYSFDYLLQNLGTTLWNGFHTANKCDEGLAFLWKKEVTCRSHVAFEFAQLAKEEILKHRGLSLETSTIFEGLSDAEALDLSRTALGSMCSISHHSLAQVVDFELATAHSQLLLVTVVNTHLWWGGSSPEANYARQLLQVHLLMQRLTDRHHVCIVGDFNCATGQLVMDYFLKGRVLRQDPRIQAAVQMGSFPSGEGDIVCPMEFVSAYSNKEPLYTHSSWHSSMCLNIDHIVITKKIQVAETLVVPDPSRDPPRHYPSDHLPLAARLVFGQEKEMEDLDL